MVAAYFIILGLCLIAFLATNAASSLCALLLVLAFGALCLLESAVGKRTLKLSYELRKVRNADHALEFAATLETPWFMIPSRIEVDVAFENHLFAIGTTQTLVLRASSKRRQTFTFEVPQTTCGKVSATVAHVRFFDAFGLTVGHVRGGFSAWQIVYPRLVPLQLQMGRSPLAAVTGTEYDKHRKGSDKSETLDVREWRQGDDQRDIHWKLSAKMGQMLVREPSRPTDYRIALMPDLGRAPRGGGAADIDSLDRALSLFVSLSAEMVRSNVPHSVVLSDGQHLHVRPVDSRSAWDLMVDELMSLSLSPAVGRAVELFSVSPECSHFTKMVYVTSQLRDDLVRLLTNRCDVTAFLVGTSAAGGFSSSDRCEVVVLSPESLEGRMQTLTV